MDKILVALLISVLTPMHGFAQISPASDDPNGALRALPFQLPAGTIPEAASREPLRLTAVPSASLQQKAADRSWPGRHPVLFGALVGLGVGIAVQAVVIPGASGGEPHSVYLPLFGGIGAGAGSLVGLIVSVARRP